MTQAVRMNRVTHVYVTDREARLAVENIDLELDPGEFVSLVWPSGCSKTTILSIIAGLLRPTRGTVEVGGAPVAGPSDRVGYMLQQDYLFPWRTILDNAMIGLELLGRANRETRGATLRLLEEMGFGDAADRYPHQLSGGMRQRVALVRTLAPSPELLLLDEPFSALDYRTKLQLEDLVWETLKQRGKTALLVTHDISEAIAMSDRVLVMDRSPGRIRREIELPRRLRTESPFYSRELPGFQELFHEIWQEFEQMET